LARRTNGARWIAAAPTDVSRRFRAARSYRDMTRLISTLAQRTEAITTTNRKAA
jgi:hypothetical protein